MSSPAPLSRADLAAHYTTYISCINTRQWSSLPQYVSENITRTGNDSHQTNLTEFTQLLKDSVNQFSELHFTIDSLVVDAEQQTVAARIGLSYRRADGEVVRFKEHTFYAWRGGVIVEIWALVDAPT